MTTPNVGPSVRNFRGQTITYTDYLTTSGLFAGQGGRATFLRHALRDLALTSADRHMIAWLADWDDHTVRTVCRWLEAARHHDPHDQPAAGRHHWRGTPGKEPDHDC